MCVYRSSSFLLLILPSSDQLRQSPPQSQHLKPLKIIQLLPSRLLRITLPNGAIIELLLHIFLLDNLGQFARTHSSSNLQHLPRELQPTNGDGLASDAFSIDEDTLVGDDIDDGGEFAFQGAVVYSGHSADLHEAVVSLG